MSILASSVADRLRTLVNPPQYGPLGMQYPQKYVEVWLHGLGDPRDVTANNVVASLRPFAIGIMFNRDDRPEANQAGLRLCMKARNSKRLLGSIGLRFIRSISLDQHQFCIFETYGTRNLCVTAPNIQIYYLRKWWRNKVQQRKNPHNFQMTRPDLRASYVFYICPRPVVLVTVAHGESGNMFPMDLIGPTDSPWYSLALRKTNPSVRTIERSRRMVLARAPYRYKNIAYDLGRHHKEASIDFTRLPFATEPSRAFGLPVASEALGIREVQVQEIHDAGSHMVFLTSLVTETPGSEPCGLQLFHAFGSYEQCLAMSEHLRVPTAQR